MNTFGYTAQQHVPTNQPQNSVKFIIDELTGQHHGIVEHIMSAINRLAAEAEKSRKLDEAARNEIFMLLGNRLSCLEGSVRALDGKVDLLGHEMRQVGAKLSLVEERISVIGHSMDRAADILRDPKQRANIPTQVGASGPTKRVNFAPNVEIRSSNSARPGPSNLSDTRPSLAERDLFSPPMNSLEDYLNPAATSFSARAATDSDLDKMEDVIVPLQPPNRQRTEPRIVQTHLHSHPNPVVSSLFNSDLSELTESEQDDTPTQRQVAVQPVKTGGTAARRKSRRIQDTNRERALVLFRKPVRALIQSKPKYKRKRKSGLSHRRKGVSKTGVNQAVSNVLTSHGVHPDYGMIGCDGCERWYHGICVDLPSYVIEDMDESQPWYCPACPPTSNLNFVKVQPTCEGGCCSLHCILGDDGYSVDGLLGRKPDLDNPPHFLWLIKWYEFGIEECTWKPTHTFDGPTLISAFYAAAQAEGIDSAYLTSAESEDKIILLSEAMNYTGSWATSYD